MKMTLTFATYIALLAVPVFAAGNQGDDFITNWDGDENGVVTLAEVIEMRENLFVTFDEDGDGMISAEEYIAFDAARAEGQAYEGISNGGHGKAAVGMTLEFNDTNGDGAVTQSEFVDQSAAWFAILDRNGGGEVTPADFGQP